MYKCIKCPTKSYSLLKGPYKPWRAELKAGRLSFVEVRVKRGIFQGDTLSPLIFVRAMMLLNQIIRKYTAGYKQSKSQKKINHFMYMNDIKLFIKSEKELETLLQTVRIYSQDVGMEFDIEKCTMLIMKRGKRHICVGVELPNQVIRMLREKGTYKYLRIL